ncbi:cytochrome C oxidase subunit IV family protein [Pseudonocardia sp. Cha107L01]|uniref:cytochrome C oxidase subunit IV family protein n=1 Tax=Pseudonocardia sp. Cha107L01 TaxID=3457576 RepID=UPI00403ED975
MVHLRNPALIVWAALILATVASTWWLAKDAFTPTVATVAIILVAALKIRFVMRYFMELRTAPLPWRLVTDAWLLAATGVILGIYLF